MITGGSLYAKACCHIAVHRSRLSMSTNFSFLQKTGITSYLKQMVVRMARCSITALSVIITYDICFSLSRLASKHGLCMHIYTHSLLLTSFLLFIERMKIQKFLRLSILGTVTCHTVIIFEE